MIRPGLRRWFENRLPRSDRCTLSQRNLYILPTKAGWGFCITLLVMLVAAINYQLNLGYALTFLLGGAGLAAMHQTHGNLRRLTLHIKPPTPVFAGAPATLEIVLDNPGQARHGVGLALYDSGGASRHAAERASGHPGMSFCDVPAGGSTVARLRFTPTQRGRQSLPTLRVETHFPLGLFRAWTVWRPAAQVLVYPAPEQPPAPLPPGQPGGHAQTPQRAGAGVEFEGVRAYRRGDTLRQVVWKKAAQTGDLVSRDSSTPLAHTLVLDYALAGAPSGTINGEARLSRLAAWVLAADRLGLGFALRLPGLALPAASGEGQRRAALEMLALWQATAPPALAPATRR